MNTVKVNVKINVKFVRKTMLDTSMMDMWKF